MESRRVEVIIAERLRVDLIGGDLYGNRGISSGGGGGAGEIDGGASPVAVTRYVARLHFWIIDGDPSGEFYDAKRPKYLLYTHGNIDNLTFDKRLYVFLAKDLGLNVVAWDYPGFGKSTGAASEDTLHRSMEAVFKWLVEHRGARRADIALWGYSLGGTIAVRAANQFPGVMGVILQAPIDR